MNYYVHNLDPIAFRIFDIPFPWYWLVYFAGYFWVYFSILKFQKEGLLRSDLKNYLNFLFVGFFVMLLSGKLFYILFYNLDYYLQKPERIFYLWEGGMSFHGALIGCGIWTYIFAKIKKIDMWAFCDPALTAVPLVLFFGRIANFINGELAGRISDVPWAVIFPKLYDMSPRHPSQVYEAVFEGLILFIYMWSRRKNILIPAKQSISFLFVYGLFRFVIEYFRMPDSQIGLVFGIVSVGQIYCIIMMAFAFGLFIFKKS